MRPFLLLSIRADDAAADNEYEAFLAFGGLPESDLQRVRLDRRPLGEIDVRDWSGFLLGGGPFNAGDDPGTKSRVQLRVEADLARLLDRIVPADAPFLGACYGIGVLGTHQRALVDRRFAEPVGPVQIRLTAAGHQDPLFRFLPATFEAFGGHKEAISRLPRHAVNLAESFACPVQAFRVGANVYATQFHPELDVEGLCTRIEVYKHAGYFPPEQAEALKAQARAASVVHPPTILREFVARYGVEAPGAGLAVAAD